MAQKLKLPTAESRHVIDVVRRRILADMKAADGYVDPRSARIARETLASLARNIQSELRSIGLDIGSALEDV